MICFQNRRQYTHRVSWQLHFGEIPNGLKVLHKCDNPGCVNPAHLFLGTQRDNLIDSINKGRYNCEGRASHGESNGSAKLTADDVSRLRAAYDATNRKYGFFAKAGREFGISSVQVRNIVLGKSWKQ